MPIGTTMSPWLISYESTLCLAPSHAGHGIVSPPICGFVLAHGMPQEQGSFWLDSASSLCWLGTLPFPPRRKSFCGGSAALIMRHSVCTEAHTMPSKWRDSTGRKKRSPHEQVGNFPTCGESRATCQIPSHSELFRNEPHRPADE